MEDIFELNEKVRQESRIADTIISETAKVIVGQKATVRKLVIALLAGGHILLEGVPGLAKTLLVNTLADIVSAQFSRIQFTPDLLPADLIGTLVYSQKTESFIPKKGPIFANFVLADEINRAPAKVQSALLEAMQERQVTIGETTYKLSEPFMVMATENPIEQEGTYQLPEAQVDRFMLKLNIGYPTREDEALILHRFIKKDAPVASQLLTPEDILRARNAVKEVYLDEKIVNYILDLVFSTRFPKKYNLGDLEKIISYGASPRATINMALAAKATAFISGRGYVIPDDVRYIATDVLRHRIGLTYEGEADNVRTEDIIQQIIAKVVVP